MTQSLLLQLIVSFLAGGCFITFLSLWAERANENVAGIILMLPSTMVLGFFFLGLTTSAEKVAEVVPATLIPLGILMASSVFYIHIAKLFASLRFPKGLQVLLSFSFSSLLWLIMALPFAFWKFTDLWMGILGYVCLSSAAHFIINSRQINAPKQKLVYTRGQVVRRAAFIGLVIAGVVLLGKLLNPFWGGVLTMYPAATFASLVAFHFYYEPYQLFYFFRKAPIGSVLLFAYALSARWLFPCIGFAWGSLASYSICILISLLLIRFQKRLLS